MYHPLAVYCTVCTAELKVWGGGEQHKEPVRSQEPVRCAAVAGSIPIEGEIRVTDESTGLLHFLLLSSHRVGRGPVS